MTTGLPFLDLTAPGFSTKSPAVLKAREAGWCARTSYGLAVLRHRQAGLLLRDKRLRQGSHAWPDIIGISGSFADFWTRSIISQEGPGHKQLRLIARTALSDDFVETLTGDFEDIAAELCDGLRALCEFEFVEVFTEPFAGRATALLLGEPPEEASQIAQDASALGLAMGPEARDHQSQTNAACDRLMQRAERLLANPPTAGLVPRLLKTAKAEGLNDHQALIDLIVILIFGGVDTTRAQLAFAIYLFAQHLDQWSWLSERPDQVPQAIEEIIRTYPTTTWATREAVESFEFDGVSVRQGETLHILVHASGTDPAIGAFSGFDIRARRKVHFGFGGGAHHCLGQHVARTDMAAALRVLLKHWQTFDIAQEPVFLPDSGNTSPASLMIRPHWTRL